MTAIAFVLIAAGAVLLWAGITGQSIVGEVRSALTS